MVQSQYSIRTDISIQKLLYLLRLFDKKKYSHMICHSKVSAELSIVSGKVTGYRRCTNINSVLRTITFIPLCIMRGVCVHYL